MFASWIGPLTSRFNKKGIITADLLEGKWWLTSNDLWLRWKWWWLMIHFDWLSIINGWLMLEEWQVWLTGGRWCSLSIPCRGHNRSLNNHIYIYPLSLSSTQNSTPSEFCLIPLGVYHHWIHQCWYPLCFTTESPPFTLLDLPY